MMDRRAAICHECSRGRDAPHKPGCESGQVAAAREAFPGLSVVIIRYLDRRDR
jgi:hypothetical protein